MRYIEMSKNRTHGGGDWEFGKALWAPTKKTDKTNWPFWSLLASVRSGDLIVHLRQDRGEFFFVGFSVAVSDGRLTLERPPDPGDWGYSDEFLRVDLQNFTRFEPPLSLDIILRDKRDDLLGYFFDNKASAEKKKLFYVRQSGRLQCLNGAYLSELDDRLMGILFNKYDTSLVEEGEFQRTVRVGERLAIYMARIGQGDFSNLVKDNYGNQCCFPGCSVDEPRFLVGSHIRRWADGMASRGEISNGLCLCLFHDKAFELGVFTLAPNLSIAVNDNKIGSNAWLVKELTPFHGMSIRRGPIVPSEDAILAHWERIKYCP
jgi:hypothetical protein